ncbi:MAG: hypothetical protein Q7J10_05145 [Methanosarcinaceae archaeon]|nr:hypothetical protein [Methanosarcinaceae archaeon]
MEVELIIDGEKVIMNDFVQKMLGNMVGGAVETLHGVEGGWNEVSLKIKH